MCSSDLTRGDPRDARRTKPARCVDADGGLFAFGGAAGTLHVHDARFPSTPVVPPRRIHDDCVNCVRMSATLRRIVTGGDDCAIAVARLPEIYLAEAPTTTATPLGVLSVAFDHSRMVAGGEDSVVRVFDAVLGEGYVDRDALAAAMRHIEGRFRGTGSMAAPAPSGGGGGAGGASRE